MNTPTDFPLPLSEKAYRELKRGIIHCEFKPGERLRVEELTKRLEISSSPIREALCRLSQDGLVNTLENRGFRVAPLTIEGMADLTRLRLLVETECLRDSLLHGDDRWEARVVAAAHSLSLIEQRLGGGPFVLDSDWEERHRAFHLSIYSACKSALMLDLVTELFESAERYRRYSASHRRSDRGKNNEHNRILSAVLARDVDKAVKIMQSHILSTQEFVKQALALRFEASIF